MSFKLSVDHVAISHNGARLLEPVRFEAENEIIAIGGPSPRSRSTLCRLLSGCLTPDEGRIRVDDSRLTTHMRRQLRLSYLPKAMDFPRPDWKALEMFANAFDLPEGWRNRAQAIANELGVDCLDKVCKKHSFESQVVAAFVHQPRMVVLDEPFGVRRSNVLQRTLIKLLREVRDDGGIAIFTAVQPDAWKGVCDRSIQLISI